jgi:hypothetical protein
VVMVGVNEGLMCRGRVRRQKSKGGHGFGWPL